MLRIAIGGTLEPADLAGLLRETGDLAAGYERVLAPDRVPTRWAGRWLVVIDSGAARRPAWSPLPRAPLPPPGSPATRVD